MTKTLMIVFVWKLIFCTNLIANIGGWKSAQIKGKAAKIMTNEREQPNQKLYQKDK